MGIAGSYAGRAATLLLAVLALAALGNAQAGRSTQTSKLTQASKLTIRVISVVVSYTPTDVKPTGTSRGDRIVYRNNLVNSVAQFGKPKGARVGYDRGTVTYTSASSARYDGTATLPGGTVKVMGSVKAIGNEVVQVPVVGGTGRYAAARGTLTIGPGTKRTPNVYVLTLPVPVA